MWIGGIELSNSFKATGFVQFSKRRLVQSCNCGFARRNKRSDVRSHECGNIQS